MTSGDFIPILSLPLETTNEVQIGHLSAMNNEVPLRKILLDLYAKHKEMAELRPEWELEPLEALRLQLTLQKDLCTQKGNQVAAQQFEMMLQIAQEAQDEDNLVQLAQRLS